MPAVNWNPESGQRTDGAKDRRFRWRWQVADFERNYACVHVKGLRDQGLSHVSAWTLTGLGAVFARNGCCPGRNHFLWPPTGHIATAVATAKCDSAAVFINDFNANFHNCHTCHISIDEFLWQLWQLALKELDNFTATSIRDMASVASRSPPGESGAEPPPP